VLNVAKHVLSFSRLEITVSSSHWTIFLRASFGLSLIGLPMLNLPQVSLGF